MVECRHFFEDDCELLPTSVTVMHELLVNAHDAFANIWSVKFPSFEHIGFPPATSKFLDSSSVVVERLGRSVSVPGPDNSWMDGLFAADIIRQFGIDPQCNSDPRRATRNSRRERIRTCIIGKYREFILF